MRTLIATSFIALALCAAPTAMANDAATAPRSAGVSVDYPQTIERLFEASVHALAVMKIPLERREADAYTANIVARRGTGSAKVNVALVRTGEASCRVVVSTTDHDDTLAALIHEKIAAALR